jgi:hypothetical protein
LKVRIVSGFQRQWRRLAMIGLAAVIIGGTVLASLGSAPRAIAQEDEEAAPACRTILRGDQTQLFLYDLNQFVPVTQLETSSVAADTPDPAGTPVAADDLLATPIAEASPEVATPLAPVASPEASPIVEITEASAQNADQLRSVVFGVLNCTNMRDFDALSDLVTNNYLRFTFAGGATLAREDLLLIAEVTVIPDLELVAFDNVKVIGDEATAEVLSLAGNQLRHEEWAFVRSSATGPWRVQRVTALVPLAVDGSATVEVAIDTQRLGTNPRDVTGGNVVLIGTNSDRVDHEMVVLRLPAGTTTDILLQSAGPDLPAGVDFIGQMTVPANGEAVLPLMNLPAGNYVVVDMLLDDAGLPNFASGYRARLVIEAAGS